MFANLEKKYGSEHGRMKYWTDMLIRRANMHISFVLFI